MTTPTAPIIINPCTGDHPECESARLAGRPVHVLPRFDRDRPTVVLPAYHYETADEARAVVAAAEANAPIVATDDDLYVYRTQRIAHRLPVGWIDPTRR